VPSLGELGPHLTQVAWRRGLRVCDESLFFKSVISFGEVTCQKTDCLTCSVHLGTVVLKDEKLARVLEYGEKQLLLTVVTLILTWNRELTGFDLPMNIISN